MAPFGVVGVACGDDNKGAGGVERPQISIPVELELVCESQNGTLNMPCCVAQLQPPQGETRSAAPLWKPSPERIQNEIVSIPLSLRFTRPTVPGLVATTNALPWTQRMLKVSWFILGCFCAVMGVCFRTALVH
mmetsp:Transcript_16646/g.24684  ORF Transcript_16646/g.24684 Transcript_16646/m.24684 type:complete len:133 (-) Transcript_16646:23-421(-)